MSCDSRTCGREAERVRALARYGLADSSTDDAFDRIVEQAARQLDAPVAFISLVDADQVWLKSRIGVDARHLSRDPNATVSTLLPDEVVAVAIDEAGEQPFSRTLAGVEEAARMRAFAAAPLKTYDGHTLGSLCVMDDRPRRFTDAEREQLRELAAAVMRRLELRRSMRQLIEVESGLRRHQASCAAGASPAALDPLTGLPDRRALLRHLRLAIERSDRRGGALVVVDLDRFKVINATLGHSAGDAVLCEVAHRLERCLETGDLAARLGDDELALVLAGIDDDPAAAAAADRIQTVLATPIRVAGQEVTASASIGVARFHGGQGRPEDLLRDAEIAMARAKRDGVGQRVLFNVLEHGFAVERLQLERDLHRAIERQQLRLQYQPIVALTNGRLHGVESLVRWAYPGRGLLWPRDFLPLAAKHGMLGAIGGWAIEEACRTFAGWRAHYGDCAPAAVSVNLAAAQLADPQLGVRLRRWLEASGLQPGEVVLEVSESTLLHLERAPLALEELHRDGLTIHIENLGTAEGSLRYLHRVPASAVKIDRSVIADMLADRRRQGMVRGIVTVAHHLGMQVVAEGVETARQLQTLAEIGCDFAQGFHLLRPVDAGTLGGLLRSQSSFYDKVPVQ